MMCFDTALLATVWQWQPCSTRLPSCWRWRYFRPPAITTTTPAFWFPPSAARVTSSRVRSSRSVRGRWWRTTVAAANAALPTCSSRTRPTGRTHPPCPPHRPPLRRNHLVRPHKNTRVPGNQFKEGRNSRDIFLILTWQYVFCLGHLKRQHVNRNR